MEENKNRYMLMCEVAELAVSRGGEVFGGFVRDFLLHEHAAKEYHMNGTESEDRFLVPSDLDIRFDTRDALESFKYELTGKGSYKIKLIRGSSYSTVTFEVSLFIQIKENYTHPVSRMLIRNKFMEYDKLIPGCNFTMDVVVSTEKKVLDFECNGLVMNSNGIQLGPELSNGLSPIGKYRRFQQVKDDILNKRAVCVNFVNKRWDKMDEKGWTLVGEFIHKTKSGDECIICQEANSDYNLGCCNARYHKACLKKTLQHDDTRCAHCREEFGYVHELKVFMTV